MLSDKKVFKPKEPRCLNRFNYPDSHKLEAIKLYLTVGNLRLVSATLDIPYITLRKWKECIWWKKVIEDLKTEDTISLSHKMKKAVSMALDVTNDRLEHGDYVFQDGKLVRKQVSMKDAAKVASDMIDRQAKLENKKEPDETKIEDRLLTLANKFAELVKKPKIEVTDVIYIKEPKEIACH